MRRLVRTLRVGKDLVNDFFLHPSPLIVKGKYVMPPQRELVKRVLRKKWQRLAAVTASVAWRRFGDKNRCYGCLDGGNYDAS